MTTADACRLNSSTSPGQPIRKPLCSSHTGDSRRSIVFRLLCLFVCLFFCLLINYCYDIAVFVIEKTAKPIVMYLSAQTMDHVIKFATWQQWGAGRGLLCLASLAPVLAPNPGDKIRNQSTFIRGKM